MDQDTAASSLSPDAMIYASGLSSMVITRIDYFLVDHQLTMKQIAFFEAGMAVRRIAGLGVHSHQRTDATVAGI